MVVSVLPYSPSAALSTSGAQRVRHGLEAVADAEHGHAGVEQLRVDARGAGLEHGSGAAGQDDGLRVLGEHLVYRHGMRHELRIHVRLAHATGDQLARTGRRNRRRAPGLSAMRLPFMRRARYEVYIGTDDIVNCVHWYCVDCLQYGRSIVAIRADIGVNDGDVVRERRTVSQN